MEEVDVVQTGRLMDEVDIVQTVRSAINDLNPYVELDALAEITRMLNDYPGPSFVDEYRPFLMRVVIEQEKQQQLFKTFTGKHVNIPNLRFAGRPEYNLVDKIPAFSFIKQVFLQQGLITNAMAVAIAEHCGSSLSAESVTMLLDGFQCSFDRFVFAERSAPSRLIQIHWYQGQWISQPERSCLTVDEVNRQIEIPKPKVKGKFTLEVPVFWLNNLIAETRCSTLLRWMTQKNGWYFLTTDQCRLLGLMHRLGV